MGEGDGVGVGGGVGSAVGDGEGGVSVTNGGAGMCGQEAKNMQKSNIITKIIFFIYEFHSVFLIILLFYHFRTGFTTDIPCLQREHNNVLYLRLSAHGGGLGIGVLVIKKILTFSFYAIAAFYVFIMLDIVFRINLFHSNVGIGMSASRAELRSYSFIPFATIGEYLSGDGFSDRAAAIRNILGNIAIFIPCGLYVRTLLKDKSFKKGLIIVIITSIAIEIIQLIFAIGACDIDDLLLNTAGGIIGLLTYKAIRYFSRDDGRAKTVVAVMSLIVGLPIMFIYFSVWLSVWLRFR